MSTFFLLFFMGQHLKAVNLDRGEYLCSWCLGAGATFRDWVNPQGSILAFLLRMSDETGGGDLDRFYFRTQWFASPLMRKTIPVALDRDKPNLPFRVESVCGSWVGDRIALVGEYDSTELYGRARRSQNISEQLATEWNKFVNTPQCHFRFEECGSCGKQ